MGEKKSYKTKLCPCCKQKEIRVENSRCWACYVKEKKNQAESNKKHCPGCNKILNDPRINYCFDCWQKIRPRKEGVYDLHGHRKIRCPQCGNFMLKDSKLCRNCHKKIKEKMKCIHHWIIDASNFGRCCKCGATEQFPTLEEILKTLPRQKRERFLETF